MAREQAAPPLTGGGVWLNRVRLIAGPGPAAFVALTFVLLTAAPAAAVPPVMTTFQVEETFVIGSCDGFEVIHHHTLNVRLVEYFDRDGNPVRIVIHFLETFSENIHSVTGEVVTEAPAGSVVVIDFADETITIIGAYFRVVNPGRGIVIHDTGIAVLDPEGNVIFEGGPHGFLQGETSACDLFA